MALNDIGILIGIIALFIGLGFVTPFINAEFETSYESYDGNTLISDDTAHAVSPTEILWSILSMFFWSFSGIPLFLNLFLLVPRIALILILARNIWIGGGS